VNRWEELWERAPAEESRLAAEYVLDPETHTLAYAQACMNLAVRRSRDGDEAAAIDYFTRAPQVVREALDAEILPDKAVGALCYHLQQAAAALVQHGQAEMALPLINEALEREAELPRDPGRPYEERRAVALSTRVSAYVRLGRELEALHDCIEAYLAFAELVELGQGNVRRNRIMLDGSAVRLRVLLRETEDA